MKIISPGYEILQDLDGFTMLKSLERIARVCYKSEGNIKEDSYINFLKNILKSGHESVIEHKSISVRFICDRGVSHELVRHRIASYSQESTRYCRYASELTFIQPCFWTEDSEQYKAWYAAMLNAEQAYFDLLNMGASPQEARSVLPNSLKTEIIATMNLREWRHFFKLRTAKDAHPQMREIAVPLLCEFQQRIPIIFEDLG